nr:hypothetical protein BaRGS_008297 [Batillaria attramentaria]
MKKLEIKTEPRDSELQRCESDDSLPPPDLPAATQEKSANEEGMELGSGEEGKEDSEEKAAPDLTCETDAVQGRSKNEGEGESSTVANGENCKKEDTSDNSAESAAQENVNTENTSSEDQAATETEEESAAEAAAAVMKEQDNGLEEETYHHDDAPLCTTQADHEELGRRCVAISNIFRSLSCIPGNEAILSRHYGLLAVLGRLLLLHHWHPPRAKAQPAPPLPKEGDGEENAEKDDVPEPMEVECTELAEEGEKDWAMSPEWWWDTLEAIRENTLVILANICSHMKMADMEQDVCLPILDGLLHWAVCPSSCACDPLPSAPQTSMLSPQRLVLEALCKLCIHDDNVDLLLATPPFSRLILLMSRLVRFLADRSQPVPREFSIVLLSRLVQGDPVAARAIALQHPSISLLIDFLESAEQSAMAVASQQGFSVLQNNPEMMGTSLDMLRRAATTLLHLARVPENRKLFLHHQSRLLTLVMSQILDTGVTQIVSDVLFECSQSAAPLT